MGNYIGKLTQETLDSTGIVNKYHVFFSVYLIGAVTTRSSSLIWCESAAEHQTTKKCSNSTSQLCRFVTLTVSPVYKEC